MWLFLGSWRLYAAYGWRRSVYELCLRDLQCCWGSPASSDFVSHEQKESRSDSRLRQLCVFTSCFLPAELSRVQWDGFFIRSVNGDRVPARADYIDAAIMTVSIKMADAAAYVNKQIGSWSFFLLVKLGDQYHNSGRYCLKPEYAHLLRMHVHTRKSWCNI